MQSKGTLSRTAEQEEAAGRLMVAAVNFQQRLDEAWELGLQVEPSTTDYAYTVGDGVEKRPRLIVEISAKLECRPFRVEG